MGHPVVLWNLDFESDMFCIFRSLSIIPFHGKRRTILPNLKFKGFRGPVQGKTGHVHVGWNQEWASNVILSRTSSLFRKPKLWLGY